MSGIGDELVSIRLEEVLELKQRIAQLEELKGWKWQHKVIEELKQRIAELELENANLKRRVTG